MITAGVFVGMGCAQYDPSIPAPEQEAVPMPPKAKGTSFFTETERQLAALLNISTDLGADSSCAPAARGGMSAGITAITARWTSQPNLDDLAASPEVLWITGYEAGQGVITCGFTRSMPDENDYYDGWRRSAFGSPPFEIYMPCAVAEPFVPTEELPLEMLGAYVNGGGLTECVDPPPPPDPGGGEGGGEGGGGEGGGGEGGGGEGALGAAPPAWPPALPGVVLPGQYKRSAAMGLQGALEKLGAEDPTLAAQASMLEREVPRALRALHASGKYAALDPVARGRAEVKEVVDRLVPNAEQLRAEMQAKALAGKPLGEVGIATGGTHCIPCAGYALITIAELVAAIASTVDIAQAPNGGVKATKWAYTIALWLACAGTSIVALWYCLTCPPVYAALAYIGNLLLDLIAMTLFTGLCIILAILGGPRC